MPVQIKCANPDCGQTLTCPDELLGKQVKCPNCATVLKVPGSDDPSSQTDTPPPTDPEAGIDTVTSTPQKSAPEDSAKPQKANTRLGRYTIKAKLGQGGMGMVYEAIQDGLERRVALKVLPNRLAKNKVYLERFKREAQAAASLDHPNIVQVYEIGEDKGLVFFSMQFIEGDTLQHRIELDGSVPVDDALDIARSTAEALSHAWNQGQIIHRDIKPDNIMLTPEGSVKVADLGLAKSVDGDDTITQTQEAGVGTPLYMAPEQARGKKDIDFRSDIYSLGITFYQSITGECPFSGETPLAVMMSHAEQPLPDASEYEDVPQSINSLLQKMCAKKPEDRFQGYSELITAIDETKSGSAIQAVPVAAAVAPAAAQRIGRTSASRRRLERARRKSSMTPFLAGLATCVLVVGVIAYTKQDVLRDVIFGLENQPEDQSKTRVSKQKKNQPTAPAVASTRQKGAPATPSSEQTKIKPKQTPEKDPLADIRKEIPNLLESGDYSKAIGMLDSASRKELSKEATDSINSLKSQVMEEAMTQFEDDKTEIAGLLKKKKYDDAIQILNRARSYGVPDVSTDASTRIVQINRLKTEEVERAKRANDLDAQIIAFSRLRRLLTPRLKEHDYEALSLLIDSQAGKPENAAFKHDLLAMKDDFKAIQQLWADYLKVMEKSIGKTETLGVNVGEVMSVGEDKIVIDQRGQKIEIPVTKVGPTRIRRKLGLQDTSRPEQLYGQGVLYAHRGIHKDADEIFVKLEGLVPGAERHLRWSKWAREVGAAEALKEFKAAQGSASASTVAKIISRITNDFGDTRLVERERDLLEESLGDLKEKLAGQQEKAEVNLDNFERLAKRAEENLKDWYESKKRNIKDLYGQEMTDPVRYKQDSFYSEGYYTFSRSTSKEANLKIIRLILKSQPKVTYYYDTDYSKTRKKLLKKEEDRLENEIKRAKAKSRGRASKLTGLYKKKKTALRNNTLRVAREIREGQEVSEDKMLNALGLDD